MIGILRVACSSKRGEWNLLHEDMFVPLGGYNGWKKGKKKSGLRTTCSFSSSFSPCGLFMYLRLFTLQKVLMSLLRWNCYMLRLIDIHYQIPNNRLKFKWFSINCISTSCIQLQCSMVENSQKLNQLNGTWEKLFLNLFLKSSIEN